MKYIFTIFILALIGFTAKAQKDSIWTKFDTIQKYPNKTLVHYRTFNDTLLIEESEAFLYPTFLKLPRFSVLGNIFKEKVKADSIVYHGSSTTFLSNRYYKIQKYDNGKLLETFYYDFNGQKITQQEYQNNDYIKIDGHTGVTYYIHGNKKRR